MLRRESFLIISFLSLLGPSKGLYAQEVTGSLQFTVVDSLGEPVPSVTATVTGVDLQGTRGTVSDEGGRCTILALPPGVISLRIEPPGVPPCRFRRRPHPAWQNDESWRDLHAPADSRHA